MRRSRGFFQGGEKGGDGRLIGRLGADEPVEDAAVRPEDDGAPLLPWVPGGASLSKAVLERLDVRQPAPRTEGQQRGSLETSLDVALQRGVGQQRDGSRQSGE